MLVRSTQGDGLMMRRHAMHQFTVTVAFIVGQLLATLPACAEETSVQEALRNRIEQIRLFQRLETDAFEISAVRLIPEFYERRNFLAAWNNQQAIADLLRAIDEIRYDGLNPADYHRQEIMYLQNTISRAPDSQHLADLDLLLTDALVRLWYHIEFGKVDPAEFDPTWNIYAEFGEEDPVVALQQAIASPSLYQLLESNKPRASIYLQTKAALRDHLAIQEAGGWETLSSGPMLKIGMNDSRVPQLCRRLVASHDLESGSPAVADTFDDRLAAAVRRFQRRHGLAADGAVGPATLQALNVSVHARIDQIRVNLERLRWVMHEPVDTFVVVNIAGFEVYYVADNQPQWRSRVQVGQPYRQTPVFKADMKYLVVNPTWTVPPTILSQDILPAIQRDPSYLQRNNLKVLDRNGQRVDPNSIAWSQYQGPNFPYVLRQDPGPGNALGLVKFIFPNPYFVFLHDTPSRRLFERQTRMFSSGCIRVENPFELATLLLADSPAWNRQRIQEAVASGRTQTFYLQKPLPVYLLYWTAYPDLAGTFHFRQDIYLRDQRLLQALDDTIQVRKHHIEKAIELMNRK